jgi:alpha-L-glutamate ligase-like protein
MTVLGMNRRNALIARLNPREAIKGVNQKFETKQRLAAAGVPVPPTLALIADEAEAADFDFASLPDAFAIKPNRGRRGEGVILVDGRLPESEGGGWRKLNGEVLTERALRAHVRRILAGELSLEGGNADAALIEPLIRTHPDFARLVPFGLPDIRIICLGDVPLMAMTRLPTVESGGRANLHQGAVGAAIDFRDGAIFRSVLGQEAVWDHPSTHAPLIGARLPFWQETVAAAQRCSGALGLGYVGVDLVIDATRGVQVLECNAYPGLEIQNVNGAGLGARIARVERQQRARERALRRASHHHRFTGVRPLHDLAGTLRDAGRMAADRIAAALAMPAPLAA